MTPAIPRANPYPGLRPFREDEEACFFGRESQVDQMVDTLAATRFLAVVGSSGSGKSSLVSCGLVPALHRGLLGRAGSQWRVAKLRPGNRPLAALAEALAAPSGLPQVGDMAAPGFTAQEWLETTLRSGKRGLLQAWADARPAAGMNLLLVADQFEELFRYRGLAGAGPAAGDAAVAFVNLLLEATAAPDARLWVVLTMRSDFLGECAQFAGLPERINRGQFLVPRMTRDERRAAIAGPARVAGTDVDPVLLTRLVNDVGDNPDQLSILQHALNRTWAAWQAAGASGPLTLVHYEGAGTMERALNRHADEALRELDEARSRALCEALFKAVTDMGTDARGIRRPTRFDDLQAITDAAAGELEAAMAPFRDPGRGFLMPPAGTELAADTVVDISHESLMRVWQQLRRWAEDEARAAQTWRRLAESAALHRDKGFNLLQPPELDMAQAWRAIQQPNRAWAERYRPGFDETIAFLEASAADWQRRQREVAEAAAARQLEAEQAQAERTEQRLREARARQNQRWGLVGLAFLACAVVGAVVLWRAAQREADEAKRQRAIAEADRLAAVTRLQQVQDAQAEVQRLQVQVQRDQQVLAEISTGPRSAAQDRAKAALQARPLVFIQYADPAQAALAERLRRDLNGQPGADYEAPPAERVGTVPSRNELRYFREEDAQGAQALRELLQKSSQLATVAVLAKGYAAKVQSTRYELWLSSARPDDLARQVQALNADDKAERLKAGQALQSRYLDSAEAIGLVLDLLAPTRIDQLSAEGRINALFFLARTDPKAWSPALRERGLETARRLEGRDAQGIRLGTQTRAELDAWKRRALETAPAKTE
jgi:hypothetical protein